MNTISLGTVLKAALLAGLLAALATAAFHTLATEPVIDQAIAIEEQRSAASGEMQGMPVVSRDTQRLGLWLGFLMYGFSWALLFGALFYLAQRWLPGAGASRRGLALALLGYWAIGLLPFLKYPANPPGVGDPATIGYRQNLYFGLLAISLAGAALSVALNYVLRRSQNPRAGGLLTLAFLVVFSVAAFVILPGSPDPVQMPESLMTSFRAFSLLGVTLFWGVLGVSFARLVRPANAGPA